MMIPITWHDETIKFSLVQGVIGLLAGPCINIWQLVLDHIYTSFQPVNQGTIDQFWLSEIKKVRCTQNK